jgi:hypothetical protein
MTAPAASDTTIVSEIYDPGQTRRAVLVTPELQSDSSMQLNFEGCFYLAFLLF